MCFQTMKYHLLHNYELIFTEYLLYPMLWLSILYPLFQLILVSSIQGRYYHNHFTEENPRLSEVKVITYLRS